MEKYYGRGLKHHYRTGQVAQWLGLSSTRVKQMFDDGELTGYRTRRGQDRRISRQSLLMLAMAMKMQIPEIGMRPFSIVMIGVDNSVASAVHRAASQTDAVVKQAANEIEFGLMLTDGETCSAVVDTSIGTNAACELAKTVRRHPITKDMLLIAIAGEDMTPTRVAQAGYDTVYRHPFNVLGLVKRLTKAAREFQESK